MTKTNDLLKLANYIENKFLIKNAEDMSAESESDKISKPDEDHQKAIFKSWYNLLDTKRNNVIERVESKKALFKDKSPPAIVPVCMVQPGQALKPGSILFKDTALLFRFGDFSEQPYTSAQSQKNYVSNLIDRISNSKNYELLIVSVDEDDVSTETSEYDNSNYMDWVAVFFK